MPIQPIPFGPNQQSGLDALSSSIQLATNVVVDQSGAVRRRPGISLYPGAPSLPVDPDGLDGVHITVGGKVYLAGGSAPIRKLYRVAGGMVADLSGSDEARLIGEGRPVWAETEAMVAVTAGSLAQKILIATDQSSRLGGNPPACSHIVANTSRLLVNNVIGNLNRVNYSDLAAGSSIAGHETWNAGEAGDYTGGSRPDPVLALAENGNEVFMFGATFMQMHTHDDNPDVVYATVSSREYGCGAPYSVVRLDDKLMWLDHRRRFVISDGRQVEVASAMIQKTLDDIEMVSDVFGYRLVLGPVDVAVWTFPTDGRSFAFANGSWSQWTGWNEVSATFARLGVRCAATHPLTGQNILGMADGRVGLFDHNVHTDLGRTIPVRAFTGFLNRGTDAIKHALAVRLAFRRGAVTSGPEPTAILSWRDDEGEWSPGLEIGLGEPGDRHPVVLLRSLGTYRRRQWRLDFDGDSEFALASASEEFELEEEG
jgi:hypothetical protein